jgi:TMEM175 potassium channel family protein
MREEKETAHRLAAYSDAVFAVIVTVMVLELRAPEQAAFSALWPLWPTAISYAVSYLFIAIIGSIAITLCGSSVLLRWD